MSWNGVKKQTQRQDVIAWCDEMGIEKYTINSKGEIDIDVDGSVNLDCRNIKELPYKFGVVEGYFSLDGCENLISLKNCPDHINFSFYCSGCSNLESLEGCPQKVGRDFNMRGSKMQLSIYDIVKICKVGSSIDVK